MRLRSQLGAEEGEEKEGEEGGEEEGEGERGGEDGGKAWREGREKGDVLDDEERGKVGFELEKEKEEEGVDASGQVVKEGRRGDEEWVGIPPPTPLSPLLAEEGGDEVVSPYCNISPHTSSNNTNSDNNNTNSTTTKKEITKNNHCISNNNTTNNTNTNTNNNTTISASATYNPLWPSTHTAHLIPTTTTSTKKVQYLALSLSIPYYCTHSLAVIPSTHTAHLIPTTTTTTTTKKVLCTIHICYFY